MNTKNSLTIGMGIFFIIVFLTFGTIVVNEKSKTIFLPKIDKKLDTYIQVKYKNIIKEININKTSYNDLTYIYEKKVTNKKNKNLYFFVNYKNKKISSSYKKDYVEGKSLLNYLEKSISNKIPKSKKYLNIKINFTKKLNNYSNNIKYLLINGNIKQIKEVPIYSINSDIYVKKIDKENLLLSINSFYNFIKSNNLKPKEYNLTLIDKNNISNALEIKKINDNLITNNLDEIISGIINNDKNINNKFNITYRYMN